MIHVGLFEGIGGFSLAARWMGWKSMFMCEIDPFCQQVLAYHFPDAHIHNDVKTLTGNEIKEEITKRAGTGWSADDVVLTGGFPCQPYSTAGKRLGKDDDRHLWPEMLRVIQELRPGWVVGENVRGIVSWNGGMVFDEVQADLEAIGYEVLPFLLPACGVGAPHRRERVWFVARDVSDTNRDGHQDRRGAEEGQQHGGGRETRGVAPSHGLVRDASDTEGIGVQGDPSPWQQEPRAQVEEGLSRRHDAGGHWEDWPTEPPIRPVDDGLPSRMVRLTIQGKEYVGSKAFSRIRREAIKAAGNAVVPQLVYEIFQAMMLAEDFLAKGVKPS